ncbi:PH domain-containing protein [Phycicoccus avicenniae]|uniref:PH domain-containing protein n=1 Tax=Phycicoccus avicenniae TaxID=2828860 RepID=UPI003D2BFACD
MSDAAGPAPAAPFRPRRGRVVPLVVAGTFVVICAAVAVGMGVSGAWGPGDQVALVVFGLLVAAFLSRYAAIRAVAGPDGLTVRNLMSTRTVGWDEIVDVRFPDGDPWVSLELADTDVLAVMAVQRVDGEEGRAEARRLAGLVRERRLRS